MDKDFIRQLDGYGLTTAQIHYHLPDQRSLIQLYLWQEYDLAPHFPALKAFLDFWQREVEGPLHSVTVAHQTLIAPARFEALDGIISVH